MSNTLNEHVGKLVVERCWCGIQHAVPESLVNEQLRQFHNGKSPLGIFCPLGHSWVLAGTPEVHRLQVDLAREKARHDQTRAELRETERRRRAEKAAKTKLRKRVGNGVCPCCHRHFTNVERHMKAMHPENE